MFIQLFQYWGYNEVLRIAAMAATTWGVLAIWARLWVKGWVGTHSLTLGLCVLMLIPPLLLYIHSQIAEELADERHLSLLEDVVEREPNRNMADFVNKLACKVDNRQDFEKKLLAYYAKHLYEKKPYLYLPVKEWRDEKKLDGRILADVYGSRGTAEFEKTAMNAKNCDWLYKEVSHYMAVQQQSQNKEALRKGYNWTGWLVLANVLSLAIVLYRVLGSINRRYCVPYPMK